MNTRKYIHIHIMGGGSVILLLDTILVPASLLITISYHAYLYHYLRHKPSLTTIGLNAMKRRCWLRELNQGDDKKGMLAIQSLRNTLMATILTATVTIIISLCLAALTNNTFDAANHLLNLRLNNNNGHSANFFGLQSGKIIVLKYGSASIFLLASFLCSSMAIACLVDANFLINALGDFSSFPDYTETVMERGFTMAVVGNRVLCTTFPLLMWMFGPVPVALSSLALVGALYELDFPTTTIKSNTTSS
ncbi:hypothetical protein ACH5RR_005118 [Cinchona calisaya]|uniref:DUF599 domain-containing protein n=1 Tax=Cinchona calisaya TaxID=153742 RepID=A0ABD3AKA3_9GENT